MYVNDKLISELPTSHILEQVTDNVGSSRLGRKVPVFAVMDAVPGTYGHGRWSQYVEITNCKIKNIPGVSVILLRTNTRINDVSLDDVKVLLRDKLVQFWLDQMYVVIWDSVRMHPFLTNLVLEGSLLENEMVMMCGLVSCECSLCWTPDLEFDDEGKVVKFMMNLMGSRWTRERRWRVMRSIQPVENAMILFRVNVRIRMVMAALIRIADMEKELESFARDIIGEISGGGTVYWPRLHRKTLEV